VEFWLSLLRKILFHTPDSLNPEFYSLYRTAWHQQDIAGQLLVLGINSRGINAQISVVDFLIKLIRISTLGFYIFKGLASIINLLKSPGYVMHQQV